MVYILNSFSINLVSRLIEEKEEVTLSVREISESEVKDLLSRNSYVSGIGHESTSTLLTQRLGVEVSYNRIFISLEEGDLAIVAQLQARLPEGSILSVEELNAFPIRYYLLKVS